MGYPIIEAKHNSSGGESLSLTNSATTTGVINQMGDEFVGLIFTAVATAVSMTFQVSADGVTYYALNDSSDAAVSQNITVNKAYVLPAQTKPFPYVKPVLNAGTATALVSRKS